VLRDNVLRHINSVVRTIASNIARTTETLFLVTGTFSFPDPLLLLQHLCYSESNDLYVMQINLVLVLYVSSLPKAMVLVAAELNIFEHRHWQI